MSASVSAKLSQIWQRRYLKPLWLYHSYINKARHFSITIQVCHAAHELLQRTRNIGVIAHIDAGKTTTTERMLYYSGFTRCIGDVDDGSTVTDFLPSERARGITIQSAAVTFNWPPVNNGSISKLESHKSLHPHVINLIDTPGHSDFTFEVLRSLRILDGAVCILDGVAGVEAQTEKVWAQAQKYKIPRIVFVNKLDRTGATFEKTVKEIASRLHGFPALCQIPWWEGGKGRFCGVGDAVNLCALKWQIGTDGKKIQRFGMEELKQIDPQFHSELIKARSSLVEYLCELDEHLLEAWLAANDDSLAINSQDIRESLRRFVLNGSGEIIPVFAGASFRNIGVQPLLDAIVDLLPGPIERPEPDISFLCQKGGSSNLLQGKLSLISESKKKVEKKSSSPFFLVSKLEACALAFKVVNDPRRGVLVYIRVYSGSIKRNAPLWNTNIHVTEKPQRILQMQASDAIELDHIDTGQIGAIIGLKYARTGDTLISYPNVNPKSGPPEPIHTLQLRPIEVPPPVFFAAIEPHSLGEQKNVENMLSLLLREDPSLQMSVDEDSGQMLLSGMGELHLEIARDRLINDFKAKATMGNVEISYRECVLLPTLEHRVVFNRDIAGNKGRASCKASIKPLSEISQGTGQTKMEKTYNFEGNLVTVRILSQIWSEEADQSSPTGLSLTLIQSALFNGAIAALARGPRRLFPLHNSHVTIVLNLDTDIYGKETSPGALSSAARLAVKASLKDSLSKNQIGIMEPVMNVVISCNEACVGAVVHDISSARGGQIVSLESGDHDDNTSNLLAIDPAKIYVPTDPFASISSSVETYSLGQKQKVKAKVPLKEMIGYLKHLRSLTAGRGTFIMSVDKFERLTGQREKLV